MANLEDEVRLNVKQSVRNFFGNCVQSVQLLTASNRNKRGKYLVVFIWGEHNL